MPHPLTAPVHTFHVPVMGTGFTIDTPLKVARFGISSVLSLVDDVLIEQMRRRICENHGRTYEPIADDDDDPRARRITAYLDLLDELVSEQVTRLRASLFEAGGELTRYFEMLPRSPLRALYEKMLTTPEGEDRAAQQARLREHVTAGGIDVNIMTRMDTGAPGETSSRLSAAMSALRGFARSRLRSSVVFSAGMNRRLLRHMLEFDDFFPDAAGDIRKRIVLKVGDFRSALLQGTLLARQGLLVSEYRVESGLNCGGHAFGSGGRLLGPILADFQRERHKLNDGLREVRDRALAALGRPTEREATPVRITVQGGLGTASENDLMMSHYGCDGTGWATPFLLVPEVTNLDADHRRRLCAAGADEVHLSAASPLGVPFWTLRESASERRRRERIDAGEPGSPCRKGYATSNTEFTALPICTASRDYQRRKLRELAAAELSDEERSARIDDVVAKACICHDLAGSATLSQGIDARALPAVCCGPNIANFSRESTLAEMTDHIYGRASLPLAPGRPHAFLAELALHLAELARDGNEKLRLNLEAGIAYYRDFAGVLPPTERAAFLAHLTELDASLQGIPATVSGS